MGELERILVIAESVSDYTRFKEDTGEPVGVYYIGVVDKENAIRHKDIFSRVIVTAAANTNRKDIVSDILSYLGLTTTDKKVSFERIPNFPLPKYPPIGQEPKQVGGTHYEKMAIQPTEYILANGIGFCEGNIIKYVSRWKDKNGIQDLEKARHYIDILIENEKKKAND